MKLKLVKEQDNSYDKDAIAVYVGSDKVGYVANSSKLILVSLPWLQNLKIFQK